MGLLCDELQAVAERVFKNLPKEHDVVVNISPGTSKSTICSILFPAWVWTRMPTARIITASHTETLVLDLANKSRSVLKDEKYRNLFPEVEIRADQDSKGSFMNSKGGDRKAFTVGGKNPMGFHGHFQIVDDPIDPEKAMSDAETLTARNFMLNTLPSRVTDKNVSVMFLIMQRLGRNDPTGVVLEASKIEGGTPIRHICLPAEVTDYISPPELKERYIDGLMDPLRLTKANLRNFYTKLGAYGYAGQFLQSPIPPGGAMFKEHWFNKRERAAPYQCRRVRYWDRAATADGGCYTAGVLMARDNEGRLYVENVEHGQWDPDERNARIVATAKRDRVRFGPKYDPIIYVEAERGSTGLESFQHLARRLLGFRVKEDQPTGSKDFRAEPWADQCAAMNVTLIDDGSWDILGFIQEHVLFRPDPSTKRLGKFKDQVDAASGAFRKLVGEKPSVGSFRVLGTSPLTKQKSMKIAVVPPDKLENTPFLEQKVMLFLFNDPKVVVPDAGLCTSPDVDVAGQGEREQLKNPVPLAPVQPIPKHSIAKPLVDFLALEFANIDPANHQSSWGEPVEPWKVPAENVIMQPDHAKKMWQKITQRRNDYPDLILLVGTHGKALSAALAIAELLHLPKKDTIWVQDAEVVDYEKPENPYIYSVVKKGRSTVV